MSQQNRPQRPRRPAQAPNQQSYPPQAPNQQGYPPQTPNQQGYPPLPPTQHQQPPLPPQQVNIVHSQKTNPILIVLSIIAWPFAKTFELARHIIGIIIEEMLRGVIRFVFGIIFLVVFFAMLAAFFVYIVAFVQVGFSFSEAFPRMIEIITGLLP
jgi:hypothetical protein